MPNKPFRNALITVFVICYTLTFHYESLRHFYLNPLFKKELPAVRFLFPPAGWIMFYRVDRQYGFTEVYGVKGKQQQLIDPHEIFKVRTIGFDNIHRGVLGTVTYRENAQSFCKHLHANFDYFDEFIVVSHYYPDFVEKPFERKDYIQYRCK